MCRRWHGCVAIAAKRRRRAGREELRRYFLYLTNERKVSGSTVNQTICALKFFYEQVLKQEWGAF